MELIDKRMIQSIHQTIFRWYLKNHRELPWRSTNDPYVILVSEIMLQQTQVKRVQEKLPLFLKEFPTLKKLAQSPKAAVIRAWRGMGYNNRAVRLHGLAKDIVRDYGGVIPSDISILKELPGIGRYTASAVACFAFNRNVPVVDVNIRRLLSRMFWKMKRLSAMRSEEDIWQLADQILPKNTPHWHHALMDLGAKVCTSRKPLCDECPVLDFCKSKLFFKPHRNYSRQKIHREPVHWGIPQRLWRGKIVEALRNINGTGSISIFKLGRTIRSSFSNKELPWLKKTLNKLSDDGLVQYAKTSRTIKVGLAEE